MKLSHHSTFSVFGKLVAVLVVVVGMSLGTVHAAYTRIDDFESYATGNVDGQGNWHSVGTAAYSQVVTDPANSANKCLRVNAAWSGCYNTLASVIPANSTATIFFRGNFPGQYVGNAQTGLSKNIPPSSMNSSDSDLTAGLEYSGWTTPYIEANNNSSFVGVLNNTGGTWYKFWIVVNTTANTYAVWTNTTGPVAASGLAFREGGTGAALPSFILGGLGSGVGNYYVDDIYIDYTGDSHAGDPTTPTAPPAPTGLTIAACNSQAVLSWSPATGATGYKVKRSTSPGAESSLGSTASTIYTDMTVTVGNTYYYVVAATNTVGVSTNSAEVSATISANSAPVVTQSPTNMVVCTGSTASFTALASGSPSVQWQVSTDNGTNWNNVSTSSGGTTTTYVTPTTAADDNGKQYRAQFTSPCGIINSSAAMLIVNTAPGVNGQPSNQSVLCGAQATFSVAATGTSLTYQWRKNTTNISGAITSSYVIPAVASGDAGSYDCVVSGACSPPATSSSATLTVSGTCGGGASAVGCQITDIHLASGQIVLSWPCRGTLEVADQVTGPWTAVPGATSPYTNPATASQEFFRINQTVDVTTLHKKVLCGYQGWFRCPGDPDNNGLNWVHWFNGSQVSDGVHVEMWPDMSELTAAEQFIVPGWNYPDGSQAYLFSPQVEATVDRHFDWMLQYGVDGVYLQRFVVDITGKTWMTNVINYARTAANRTGRAFAIAYDAAGSDENTVVSQITGDWKWLTDTAKVTSDPRYLHHNGKPVVMIWEFSTSRFPGANGAAVAHSLVSWFKTNGTYNVTFVGGTIWDWRTNPTYTNSAWRSVFHSFDILCPWNTGNYATVGTNKYATTSFWAGDMADLAPYGVVYYPEMYPGFSWDNMNNYPPGTSTIPRMGGNFLWQQFYTAATLGLDMAYVGMFDEVDEGTAIFKVTNTPPVQHHFVTYDGYPSDWYMRLTAAGGKMLNGQIPITPIIPTTP